MLSFCIIINSLSTSAVLLLWPLYIKLHFQVRSNACRRIPGTTCTVKAFDLAVTVVSDTDMAYAATSGPTRSTRCSYCSLVRYLPTSLLRHAPY